MASNESKKTPSGQPISRQVSIPSSDKVLEGAKQTAEAAGKTAVAAALAGAVATGAAAVTPDQIHLPEPVPIVQTLDYGSGADLPDAPADDTQDTKAAAWKRALTILKYALIALFAIAAFVFGMLSGCASCVAGLPFTTDASSSEVAELSSAG